MTGPEHYKKAEFILKYVDEMDAEAARHSVAVAQVHATLAQAAATAMAAYTDDGMTPEDWGVWSEVASVEGKAVDLAE